MNVEPFSEPDKLLAKEYLVMVWRTFSQKYAVWFLIPLVIIVAAAQYVSFAMNLSESLPGHVFMILKRQAYEDYKRGDLVAYRWQGDYYVKGTQMIKIIGGVPGDTVSRVGKEFFINGNSVGVAKDRTLLNLPIEANTFSGIIPKPYFWVMTPHKDSLDSRYQTTGLIGYGQFIGKAIKVF